MNALGYDVARLVFNVVLAMHLPLYLWSWDNIKLSYSVGEWERE
jgi:hypothetical protein